MGGSLPKRKICPLLRQFHSPSPEGKGLVFFPPSGLASPGDRWQLMRNPLPVPNLSPSVRTPRGAASLFPSEEVEVLPLNVLFKGFSQPLCLLWQPSLHSLRGPHTLKTALTSLFPLGESSPVTPGTHKSRRPPTPKPPQEQEASPGQASARPPKLPRRRRRHLS